MYAAYYRHVVKAEKTGDRDIKFTFDTPGNANCRMIVGEFTVLPKHWWEGTDSEGRKRDISATTLEKPWVPAPIASRNLSPAGRRGGAGQGLLGRELRSSRANNFDELRYEYFRDNLVALEAFKADQVDWLTEN